MTLILAGPELAFQHNTCIDLSPEDVGWVLTGRVLKNNEVQQKRVT